MYINYFVKINFLALSRPTSWRPVAAIPLINALIRRWTKQKHQDYYISVETATYNSVHV